MRAWWPGDQHLRHGTPLPDLGSRVVGILQQVARETLLAQRHRRPDHAWEQADTGIDQGDRRRLTARQHDVAKRKLFQVARFDDPLVDPLEAAA